MSVLNENQLVGASAGGDYEIEQSLRFDEWLVVLPFKNHILAQHGKEHSL